MVCHHASKMNQESSTKNKAMALRCSTDGHIYTHTPGFVVCCPVCRGPVCSSSSLLKVTSNISRNASQANISRIPQRHVYRGRCRMELRWLSIDSYAPHDACPAPTTPLSLTQKTRRTILLSPTWPSSVRHSRLDLHAETHCATTTDVPMLSKR